MTSMILDSSLPNQIAKRIAEQIMDGRFIPGESLREGDFSTEFGTSRAPIREAFYLLENDGLVQRVPRRGVFVKGYSSSEMYNLFELRGMVEQLSLKRFGEFAKLSEAKQPLAQLENVIDQMKVFEKNGGDREAYSDLNVEFHQQLIRLSGSEVLENFYLRMGTPLNALVKVSFIEASNIQQSVSEHKKMVQLLKDQDIGQAQEILKKHNEATIARLEKIFLHKEM
jgi:DNA-binding GntR family transcriptional regulator